MHHLFGLSLSLFFSALVLSYYQERTKRHLLLGAILVFVYLCMSAFYIVADYFTGEGINDAVIFHLRYGLDGSGFGDYYLIIAIGVGLFIVSLMSSIAYYRILGAQKVTHFSRVKQVLVVFLLVCAWAIHPSFSILYGTLLKSVGYESALAREYSFLDYYQTPILEANSEEHPNLVYIFAESFETTYFDEKLFPSLVTHLRALESQSTTFSDIRQVFGTGWTIAGMTSALCGIPLVTPTTNEHSPQGNSMSKMRTFYSGAVCMSDLLHQNGNKKERAEKCEKGTENQLC